MTSMIFGSPGRYIQGNGILRDAGTIISQYGKDILLVADDMVMDLIAPSLEQQCAKLGLAVSRVPANKDVTAKNIAELAGASERYPADIVVAAGGGKSIDSGKALANARNLPFITMPTVASNDAPTSKNYVVYNEHHQLESVGNLPYSPAAVIVDTALIAAAPAPFLLAGLGDAITKKFEAEQALAAFGNRGRNGFQARPSLAAVAVADKGYGVIRQYAEEGLKAAGTGQPTEAFEYLVEAALLMSGLGFESGGLSIAHALTRGLTAMDGAKKAPHGLQVAYGLLVQLTLEGRSGEFMDDLTGFYRKLGLPRTLADLGAPGVPADVLATAAELTMKAPHTANFARVLTAEDIVAAMVRVERNSGTPPNC